MQRLRGMSRVVKISGAAAVLLVAAIVAVSLAGNGAGAAPRTPPAARNFALRELGHPGRKVTLAAFAGRPVIVNFFASWCTPCKLETPTLARFYRESGERTAIIGVDSNDETGTALRFVHSAGVPATRSGSIRCRPRRRSPTGCWRCPRRSSSTRGIASSSGSSGR